MKLFTLIILLTAYSQLYAQTLETPLESIYRADSVHVPVDLYKQDNVLINLLYRELQLCDSLRVLDAEELRLTNEIADTVINERDRARVQLYNEKKDHENTKGKFISANIERWIYRGAITIGIILRVI